MSRALAIAITAGSVRHGFGPRWSPPRISRAGSMSSARARPWTNRTKSAGVMPIAAELVDLIAGRLDLDRRGIGAIAVQDRREGFRMRAAPRGQARGLARKIARDDVRQVHVAPRRIRSIPGREELPSIGPRCDTAKAPAALARASASAIACPAASSVTKVAQKQSPAPVGSTKLVGCAGKDTVPPASRPIQP